MDVILFWGNLTRTGASCFQRLVGLAVLQKRSLWFRLTKVNIWGLNARTVVIKISAHF